MVKYNKIGISCTFGKPPTSTGNNHSGKASVHPILLVRLVTLPVVTNNFTPNSQFCETTPHLTNAIREPSGLPDTQEVVGILLSKLFRIVVFI